jgi:hypothetical protein
MKRHEKPYPNKNNSLLMPKIMNEEFNFIFSIQQPFRQMWEDGWLDNYSDNHFLIRMINNDKEYFEQCLKKTIGEYTYDFIIGSDPFTCIMNLNKDLLFLIKYFGSEPIKEFIQEQFAAGKAQYNEKTFFEALSEVHILLYFLNLYNASTTECSYEPKTGTGNHNPEVSYKYEFGLKLNIEVKTPNFTTLQSKPNVVMPLVCLSKDGRGLFDDFCKSNRMNGILPRVLKLKDFINSACEKFHVPEENEYNILFINWTYTDTPYMGFLEPEYLLNNPHNGILLNQDMADKLGINNNMYKLISAIFIYQDAAENVIYSDFRYLFASRNAVLLPNKFILDNDLKLNNFYKNMRFRNNDFAPHKISNIYFNNFESFPCLKDLEDLILKNLL